MSSEATALQNAIDRAYAEVNRYVARRLAERGYPDIRAAHAKVFEQLRHRRVRDMAEAANVTKQAMGELVAQLEDAGYLERVPDPDDGRARIVLLTAKGRRCVKAAEEVITELHDQWVAALGEQRVRAARRAIETVVSLSRQDRSS